MFNWELTTLTDGLRSFRNTSWLGHRLCMGHRLPNFNSCSINLSDWIDFVKQEYYACLSQKVFGDVVMRNMVEEHSSLACLHENMTFQKVTISMPYSWKWGCFTSYLLWSSQGKTGQNTPVWTLMKDRATTTRHLWLTAPVLLISSPLVLDSGYCHCSASNPLSDVLWVSLPQLLTVWGMMKCSLSKRTCALILCCISYLNGDSGILEEEKRERK